MALRDPELPRDGGTRAARIEYLADRMSRPVRDAPPEERDDRRDYAADLLREHIHSSPANAQAVAREQRSVSPFAVAALLAITGFALTLAVAPVGVIVLLMAVLTMAWGVIRLMLPGYEPDWSRAWPQHDREQPH
jgi:hypothetical protein